MTDTIETPPRPDVEAIRKRARMTNWDKEADVLACCDWIAHLERRSPELTEDDREAATEYARNAPGYDADGPTMIRAFMYGADHVRASTRSPEPTADDRLRWATYAVEAGYAEWSERPGRTTANKEAYFTLFRILEREHRSRASTRSPEPTAERDRLRKALAEWGDWVAAHGGSGISVPVHATAVAMECALLTARLERLSPEPTKGPS